MSGSDNKRWDTMTDGELAAYVGAGGDIVGQALERQREEANAKPNLLRQTAIPTTPITPTGTVDGNPFKRT